MLVAQVAKQELHPADVSDIDDVLSSWARDFPGMSKFVSASVWPDHIKCTPRSYRQLCRDMPAVGLLAFDEWHYADLPLNPGGLPGAPTADQATGDPSAVWALRQAVLTFRTSQSVFAFNLMLRFAIHIVGDLHQPLHDAQAFFNDSRFGDLSHGDRGGNLFNIRAEQWNNLPNLHLLWDAAGGLYLTEWPFAHADWELLQTNATALSRRFPRESLPTYMASDMACFHEPDNDCGQVFRRWSEEAHWVAAREAYGHGISRGGVPSEMYLENVREVSQRQIALAGYRLADLLAAAAPLLPTSGVPGRGERGLGQSAPQEFAAVGSTSSSWSEEVLRRMGPEALISICAIQTALLMALVAARLWATLTRRAAAVGARQSPLGHVRLLDDDSA